VFYPAKLLKHGRNCLCFASKEFISEGEKIIHHESKGSFDGNIKIIF